MALAATQLTTTRRGLPLFITEKNKYAVGLLLWVVALLLYLPSNHFHLSEPQLLPMWWIDEAVPFIPQTVWIYLSEYVFFGAIYLASKDMANLTRYFYSFLALQTTSVLIFIFWPTTFPRELFPLPASLDSLTYAAFHSLRMTDSPASCAPSLHVSSVYLSSFIYLHEQRGKLPFFFLWATAIALSTLTTKQHYLIDVVTGLMMAVAFYWIFHRLVPYRRGRTVMAPGEPKRR